MPKVKRKCVYHRVPIDQQGSVLYPLNQLATRFPATYAMQRQKYGGREALMAVTIPGLGCLWNDALHLSPTHPHLIAAALGVAHRQADAPAELQAQGAGDRWYVIPAERLVGSPAVVFANSPRSDEADFAFHAEEFTPFDLATYQEVTSIPEVMIDYYAAQYAAGRRPLMFMWLPHVLLATPLDVTGLETIAFRETP